MREDGCLQVRKLEQLGRTPNREQFYGNGDAFTGLCQVAVGGEDWSSGPSTGENVFHDYLAARSVEPRCELNRTFHQLVGGWSDLWQDRSVLPSHSSIALPASLPARCGNQRLVAIRN